MDPPEHEGNPDVIFRAFDVNAIRSLDDKTRSVTFVCSTSSIDRYGEIVEQSWNLDAYNKNPVVLFAHQSRELPIGRAPNMAVKRDKETGLDQLECTVVFATEKANPKAEQIFQLCKEDILRTVSVGFIPRTVRYEMRDGKEVCVLADNELCELSVTPVPANPDALAKHLARARRLAAQSATETATMDQKEIDALKAKATKDEERATAAETKVKALEGTLAERDTAILEHTEKLAAKDVVIGERDATIVSKDAEITTLGSKVDELEVDALIGKKLLPTEKQDFLEIKRSNPKLYESMLSKRKDLGLLSKAIGADANAHENSAADAGSDANGDDMAKRSKAKANKKVSAG